ncbi:hypothetical protein CC79DRAFT_1335074 [Sarocladium strictum]
MASQLVASHLDPGFPIKPALLLVQVAGYGPAWDVCKKALHRANLFVPLNALAGDHARSNAQIEVITDFMKLFAEFHHNVVIATNKITPLVHIAVAWSNEDFETVRFPRFQKAFLNLCIAQSRFGSSEPTVPEVSPEILARVEALEGNQAEQDAALARMQARLQNEPWYLAEFARKLLEWNMVPDPEDLEMVELVARSI